MSRPPPLARTRENTLFAGSDLDGRPWAAIACVVVPGGLNGVKPRADLGAVITRIVDGQPRSRLDAVLPWASPTVPGLTAAA